MDLKAFVIPLHQDWKCLETCCNLINDEWPRSNTARLYSLKSSCDALPTSLILIIFDGNEKLVIGHSKVSPIHRYPSACFVESVVIDKKFRGKGWGNYIMQETEKYVKTKGKTTIFLSTTDKEKFYSQLGYNKCEPVSIYGCKNFQMSSAYMPSLLPLKQLSINQQKKNTLVPPPPRPPPTLNIQDLNTKVYMMKSIS